VPDSAALWLSQQQGSRTASGGGHEQLISNKKSGRFKLAFAERDKKQSPYF
jgi:hypothetical protein